MGSIGDRFDSLLRRGAVVCMIAAVELGPLAFAGAGAFALMGFGFMNYQQPKPDELIVYFFERYIIFDHKGKEIVDVEGDSPSIRNSRTLFCNLEDKARIIDLIRSHMKESLVVEINDSSEAVTFEQYRLEH